MMKKALFAIIVSLGLILTASAGVFLPTNSIQPIQRINDDGVVVNICTAFSINKEKGYWLSAYHCWDENDMFNGQKLELFSYNPKRDLMVFVGPNRESLKLAIKEPEVGDDVYLVGYPHGSLDLLTFFGKFSSKDARVLFTQPEFRTQVINILGLPGDSGGPILDTSGRVIGISQVSSQNGVVWGASWKVLVEQTSQFWEQ